MNLTTDGRAEARSEGARPGIPDQKHWTSAAVQLDFAD
jgi:hypothetical protein